MIFIGATMTPEKMREAIKRLEEKPKLNDIEKAILAGLKAQLSATKTP